MSTFLRLVSIAGVWLLVSGRSIAAEPEDGDPPDRVARVSYLSGDVSLQTPDDDAWSEASLNRPLTTGDRVKLESDARAELQVGELDVHVDQRSDFSFLELSDDVAQFRLTEGELHLSVRNLHDHEVVEVDTPQAAVTIVRPGEYSIALREGMRTLVKTFVGEVEVSDHTQTLALKSGEQASFFASDVNPSRPIIETLEARNAFETWAYDRSRGYERSASARYVSPDVIGYTDLDRYGDWSDEPDYGHVWYPSQVTVDWSPYRFGHWAWVGPWGWTWIDDAPWGFAPFHYGRWAHVRGRWGWIPGPIHVRPVYAPALVAWVGAPPIHGGISISVSSGIGWFPLAPREVFVPGYRCSPRHIHDVNYSNTIVNNIYINRVYNDRSTHFDYVNRHVGGAVTVVQHDAFARSRPVQEHLVRVDARELQNWHTRNSVPEVQPPRVRVVDPARSFESQRREIVMRHAPLQPPNATAGVVRERNFSERERNDRFPTRANGGSNSRAPRLESAPQNRTVTPQTAPPTRNGAAVLQPQETHRAPPADVRRDFSRERESRFERVRPTETRPAPTPQSQEFHNAPERMRQFDRPQHVERNERFQPPPRPEVQRAPMLQPQFAHPQPQPLPQVVAPRPQPQVQQPQIQPPSQRHEDHDPQHGRQHVQER